MAEPYAVILILWRTQRSLRRTRTTVIRWQILKSKQFVDMEQTVFMIETNPTGDEDWPYLLRLELRVDDNKEPL